MRVLKLPRGNQFIYANRIIEKCILFFCRDYKARLQFYKKPIWTCKLSGHTNLTHKDASEKEESCKER